MTALRVPIDEGPSKPFPGPGWIDEAVKTRLVRALVNRSRHGRRDPQGEPRPVSAAVLWRALRLPGRCRETGRRRARELVERVRTDGAPVASDGRGYWLAETAGDFSTYVEFVRSMGVNHLATAARAKRSDAYAQARGQRVLPAFRAGCTGVGAGRLLDLYPPPEANSPPALDPEADPPTFGRSLFD